MRRCRWCDKDIELPSKEWPWPLCLECEQKVLQKAQELVDTNEPVVYPAFGHLVPSEILNEGGYWQFDVRNTLESHHGWLRHRNIDRHGWGQCGYPPSQKPQTHFHPPERA